MRLQWSADMNSATGNADVLHARLFPLKASPVAPHPNRRLPCVLQSGASCHSDSCSRPREASASQKPHRRAGCCCCCFWLSGESFSDVCIIVWLLFIQQLLYDFPPDSPTGFSLTNHPRSAPTLTLSPLPPWCCSD